ncbi:hypothetical protein PHYSODRAFT_286925 [Phytophthora sojae]|uniref:Uncharacterized protein n=1 Tax=Phytophthora sojae (strain P6497) TaxID=1094619 RepID=G4ZYS2_PHYSP|nr:hypothetical protein PHYSODRAFT_286925 [Phytophthora sojae]EGZ12105.1 hypothetical protein PHYSODRAFT_286925 [Phytophthora sojae]|eukprot:XP_009532438.1 hypothetical protein PHYSODRAFT_286925 [Phytophthora sojae]
MEIRLLESRAALLRTQNLPAHLVVERDPILRPLAQELAVLRYANQAQQLHVAKMQSALSRALIDQPYYPLHSRICLSRDWSERRSTLLGMQDDKLRRAYEFVIAQRNFPRGGSRMRKATCAVFASTWFNFPASSRSSKFSTRYHSS